jgi:hypothetical protein
MLRSWRTARLRLKEWDFYGTTTAGGLHLGVAVAHGGIAGLVFANVVDVARRTVRERTLITPLGWRCSLPATSRAGDVSFRLRGVRIDFVREPARRLVRVEWPRFDGEHALRADLEIDHPPDRDAVLVNTPLDATGRRFYLNEKVPGMPTRGSLEIGPERLDLQRERALTVLDWGRGVWPYRTTWRWTTGAGHLADGRVFALNLGHVCGVFAESAIFVDGRVTKLRGDDDPRVAGLRLEPAFRVAKDQSWLVVASAIDQDFGTFSGTVETAGGERIEVRGVPGWTEEHRARW